MMEWTVKDNRMAVTALYKCGIERTLYFFSFYYACFLYHSVKLFLDTGRVSDRKSGSYATGYNAVRSRINRNPVRKQKIIAREMDIEPMDVVHTAIDEWPNRL